MNEWTPLLLILAIASFVFAVLGFIADHRVSDEAVDAWLRNHRGRPW
jgi:predicted membrane protein